MCCSQSVSFCSSQEHPRSLKTTPFASIEVDLWAFKSGLGDPMGGLSRLGGLGGLALTRARACQLFGSYKALLLSTFRSYVLAKPNSWAAVGEAICTRQLLCIRLLSIPLVNSPKAMSRILYGFQALRDNCEMISPLSISCIELYILPPSVSE